MEKDNPSYNQNVFKFFKSFAYQPDQIKERLLTFNGKPKLKAMNERITYLNETMGVSAGTQKI